MGLYCDLIRLSDQEVKKCFELSDEEAIYALVQENRADDWFDIDKAWHGIHFILNSPFPADTKPFDFLLRGGTPLTARNWQDIYGVDAPDMRAFDSLQVKEIDTALSTITKKAFRSGYNPTLMAQLEIYPRIWEKQKDRLTWFLAKYLKLSSELNYLVFHFNRLKLFLDGAVERDLGLIIKYHQ
jgi:hypothetical protein